MCKEGRTLRRGIGDEEFSDKEMTIECSASAESSELSTRLDFEINRPCHFPQAFTVASCQAIH